MAIALLFYDFYGIGLCLRVDRLFRFLKGSLSKLSPLSVVVFAVVVFSCKSYVKIKEISIKIYSRFPGD